MRASSLPIAFGVAVLGPDLVGDVAAAGLQVLVPAAFAQDPSPMPPKGVGFPDPLSGTLNWNFPAKIGPKTRSQVTAMRDIAPLLF